MASFFHDESRLNEFARRAQELSDKKHKALSGPEGCEVDVLEWPASKYAFSLSAQQYSFNSVLNSFFFCLSRMAERRREKLEVVYFSYDLIMTLPTSPFFY